MLSDVAVVPIDNEIAHRCGELRATLQRQGTAIPTVDMLIGYTGLVHDLTVVSHNSKHFRMVPNLRVEDWLVS